jgi:glutamine synthetase
MTKQETESSIQTQRAKIERLVEEHQIDTVKLGGVDIDGIWRGKRQPIEYFMQDVWQHGTHICDIMLGWDLQDNLIPGVSYTGWHTGYPDFHLVPVLDTFAAVPWEPGTASVLCEWIRPDGTPHPFGPREILRKVVKRAEKLGYKPKIGYEVEFYVFRENVDSVVEKNYQNLTPIAPGMRTYSMYRGTLSEYFIGDLRKQMQRYGIVVETSHTEYGPGQFEVNLHYSDALDVADQVSLYKAGVKEIAAKHGLMVTFMAKFDHKLVGSSGHLHQSLWDMEGHNLFAPKDGEPISELGGHYAAGLIETMAEMTVFFCPTLNSYKRKRPLTWSGTTATWGVDNRTVALRVIPAGPKASRIEHRTPGADANPYLAIAAAVAGGLYGVEKRLQPPEMVRGNAYELADPSLLLPETLDQAVEALDRSKRAREFLGAEFVDHYLQTRRWELECERNTVTDFERSRYFEVI